MYRSLDPDKILITLKTLHNRIEERFPGSGLGRVCGDLFNIAMESRSRAEWISRPNIGLRIGTISVILLSLVILFYSVSDVNFSFRAFDVGELIQILEAGLNNLILIGAAVFFLVTIEVRLKRTRALSALHELRVIAHVIDMHQLTKDPYTARCHGPATPSSPERKLTPFELTRYLDYCSEMLSLTGKVAALYIQDFSDSVVIKAVNDVENLTTHLSRKIWQKIMIIRRLDKSKKTIPLKAEKE